jgi:hypothetical protein
MVPTCKGKTAAGESCKKPASSTGFCSIHDPELVAAAKAREATRAKKRKSLDEVLNKAIEAAQGKGWSSTVTHRDQANWRYASLQVSKSFGFEHVSGTFEFDLSPEDLNVQRHTTSFHGHGLDALHNAILESIATLPWLKKKDAQKAASPVPDGFSKLAGMLRRFDRYVRQLNRRYGERAGLSVADEYDVQDLLHALLRSVADDVRAEEVSPSYAGASSRIDFLLKKEQMVVEVKLASGRLRDKDVGEQLIVDIKRYQSHPDCKALLCLVYDPANHIKNPQGLESDLTGKHNGLDVIVIVVPQ